MDGAISGQVAVGRYVLQIGDPGGAVVREASRTERAHLRPRPTPILLLPKLIRGLLDRRGERAQHRHDAEPAHAQREDPPLAVQVAQRAGDEDQGAERQQVGVRHPLLARQPAAKLTFKVRG